MLFLCVSRYVAQSHPGKKSAIFIARVFWAESDMVRISHTAPPRIQKAIYTSVENSEFVKPCGKEQPVKIFLVL